MVLYKIKAQQVLVATGSGLDGVNLGNGRAVCGFQLQIKIAYSGRVKHKLFPTGRTVSRGAAGKQPFINAAAPYMHHIAVLRDRIPT